ncbi:hypothetical protein [Bradyrhizobium sp. RT11b]|uniref:hypothetical protein n=1 Tax=Bradyrhizobium sp. RT11b TaxID=3156332 RepID=UPI00339A5F05
MAALAVLAVPTIGFEIYHSGHSVLHWHWDSPWDYLGAFLLVSGVAFAAHELKHWWNHYPKLAVVQTLYLCALSLTGGLFFNGYANIEQGWSAFVPAAEAFAATVALYVLRVWLAEPEAEEARRSKQRYSKDSSLEVDKEWTKNPFSKIPKNSRADPRWV